MALMRLLFILMLHFEAALSEAKFYRNGQSVALRCTTDLSHTCRDVIWFYNRDGGVSLVEVRKRNIIAQSGRAARLSVNADCSLIIHNISAEDYGSYICRVRDRTDLDTIIYLSILTISPSPPNADTGNDEVTLKCSLERDMHLGPCNLYSFRWLDERRTELIAALSGRAETFYRNGQSVVLRCTTDVPHTCRDVDWLYNRDGSVTLTKVRKGNIEAESGRAARLSVNADCSLIINNISAEDYGRYTCRVRDSIPHDTNINLSILTNANTGNDEVTLECSLERDRDLGQCKPNSIRWLDERRTELTGKGDGYELRGQANCVSYLTVSLQRANSRTFTCQFVEENRVQVEAQYSPVPAVTLSTTSVPTTAQPPKLQPPRDTFIGIGAAVGVGLVLLLITIAVLTKFRRKGGATEEQKAPAVMI
ncbi:unnamed protein product [Menidia menidia]|uniref:(Atlantic silverside) hypothetical protein n=1 Tax=Menidia menidia TaxID=238744 RepID=A0A8S4B2R5_9TELE|nr:unnamed protein product [Menidia menidia]